MRIQSDGPAKIPTIVQRIVERNDDLVSGGIDRVQNETDPAAISARIAQPGCSKTDLDWRAASNARPDLSFAGRCSR